MAPPATIYRCGIRHLSRFLSRKCEAGEQRLSYPNSGVKHEPKQFYPASLTPSTVDYTNHDFGCVTVIARPRGEGLPFAIFSPSIVGRLFRLSRCGEGLLFRDIFRLLLIHSSFVHHVAPRPVFPKRANLSRGCRNIIGMELNILVVSFCGTLIYTPFEFVVPLLVGRQEIRFGCLAIPQY